MKHIFLKSLFYCIFAGVGVPVFAQPFSNELKRSAQPANASPIKFIEGIEINRDTRTSSVLIEPQVIPTPELSYSSVSIENSKSIQFKYALLLNREVEAISNIKLFSFIEDWWETRYRYGGSSKKGIDCSAFSGLLFSSVFDVNLPRTARDQYDACTKVDKSNMAEGDLVFFNTRGGISHVGVYLGDGYFVHASTGNGVTINNLESEEYYQKRFISAGRPIRSVPEELAVELNCDPIDCP
jgi:lipoprotein Spr